MPARLEIALSPQLPDAEGRGVTRRAGDYLGLDLTEVRVINTLTLDTGLTPDQLEAVKGIFVNPVFQVGSWQPLARDFDVLLWVGLRPGVRDNPGATAAEAIQDALGLKFPEDWAVFTSKQYALSGPGATAAGADRLAAQILANDIIQQWRVVTRKEWDPEAGIGLIMPRVKLAHRPSVSVFSLDSDQTLAQLSAERNLALNPNDVPVIRRYFLRDEVRGKRQTVGLDEPTDVELEFISQARSDHCNHNTFRAKFFYSEPETGRKETFDSLFKTFIERPTLDIQKKKPWVVSVLWDNAGAAAFDDDHLYTITAETHNSPSNMEAYGGAITGIVGVYRDPMGTGLGSKLIAGLYGFHVAPRDYDGPLLPHLHPRRLLDGVIEGVKDGGNKSGIPTPFGSLLFHPDYLGKCLVFVTAVGLMPRMIGDKPAHLKRPRPGDLIVMTGGRVGKDGIHGVTAASEGFSEHTPAGHVQIGDPYTQKKMHDFLLQARDEGLLSFITDNGGGGLSSSVGESAVKGGGAEVDLDKVPLKYAGLDPWEIWVSESQERMTAAVPPENFRRFMDLARLHDVEATAIGHYTDTGMLHLRHQGQTCAYVELTLLTEDFPQWEFEAEWTSPRARGLAEPELTAAPNQGALLLEMLGRPNVCDRSWIARQYDHEVQGGSVIKPLVGPRGLGPSDGAVIRPLHHSRRGLALSQAALPFYSAIDTYHMTTATIDEAVRRVLAVGGRRAELGGIDNFCWPEVTHDPGRIPDGKYKAAQLVRSNLALRDMCLGLGVPLLSGKDSMYIDGNLADAAGRKTRVSGPPTIQFTAVSTVEDVDRCQTMEAKFAGDAIYVVGLTRDELGGSEFYERSGHIGLNVPQVRLDEVQAAYEFIEAGISRRLFSSVHGVYRGGLGVHLALVALAGDLGMSLNLDAVPGAEALTTEQVLYSESPGRFIVTVNPAVEPDLTSLLDKVEARWIGMVTSDARFRVNARRQEILNLSVEEMITAWRARFGGLV
jgi:phosphoribosylformylglycinamidine synthase II